MVWRGGEVGAVKSVAYFAALNVSFMHKNYMALQLRSSSWSNPESAACFKFN